MNNNKVVLVVGAGDATGGAIARRFAREGYVACLTRRSADKLQPLVEAINAEGGEIIVIELNVDNLLCCPKFFDPFYPFDGQQLLLGIFNNPAKLDGVVTIVCDGQEYSGDIAEIIINNRAVCPLRQVAFRIVYFSAKVIPQLG